MLNPSEILLGYELEQYENFTTYMLFTFKLEPKKFGMSLPLHFANHLPEFL